MSRRALPKEERAARQMLYHGEVSIVFATDRIVVAEDPHHGQWNVRFTEKQGWVCTCQRAIRPCRHMRAVAKVTGREFSQSLTLEVLLGGQEDSSTSDAGERTGVRG